MSTVCNYYSWLSFNRNVFCTMTMRQNDNRLEVTAVIVVFVAGALIFMASNSSTYNIANAQGSQQQKNVVRDSQTILLEGKTIPAKDFIHLYDSIPYMIMNGHIAMKVPCDTSSKPAVNVLIGSAPDVKPVQPELVKELSKPGSMCIYHVDVGSDVAKKIIQTDIAIQNPTDKTITFPPTSTFVIGVNEIAPLQGSSSGGNMTMSK